MVLHALAYHPLSDLLSNLLPKSLPQDLCACCILPIELTILEQLDDGSHQICYGRCPGALSSLTVAWADTVVPVHIPPPVLTFLMWVDGFLVGAPPTPGGVLKACMGQARWDLESTPASSSPGCGNSEVC